MGLLDLFSSKKSERAESAERFEKKAAEESEKGREEARKMAERKKRLASGQSQDPEADRYMIREHDSNRWVAEANARDFRRMAANDRGRWF